MCLNIKRINCYGKKWKNSTHRKQKKNFGAADHYYAVWVKNTKGSEYPLLFTERELRVAIKRAEKNPEDIPQKGFFLNP